VADDAAGAVRRTPRPAAKPPTAWWSPTEGFWTTNDGPVDGLRVLDFADEFRAYPPNDAVQLVGPDQRRPVVLLRADDCDCGPPYADCLHGPEPVDALDLAVWLHAEAKHQHAELLAQRDGWWEHCNRERDALQAQIAAALALMDYWDAHGGSIPQGHRLRAALQDDQPAGVPCSEGCGMYYTGPLPVPADHPPHNRDAGGERCPGQFVAPAEPTGEADRG
jgi:hypothetical protein